jgi:hypothetical protein
VSGKAIVATLVGMVLLKACTSGVFTHHSTEWESGYKTGADMERMVTIPGSDDDIARACAYLTRSTGSSDDWNDGCVAGANDNR